jgi:hypothetical protein
VGDVNGDGYADVLASSFQGVQLYLGAAPMPHTTPDWVASLDSDVQSVATAGDVNGDGFADILIGEGSASNKGRALVWLRSADIATRADGSVSNADWTTVGSQTGGGYGASVACGAT